MAESVAGAAGGADEGIAIPSDNDVILGRTKLAKNHPGNSIFRAIVRHHKVQYASPSCKKHRDKKSVVDSIIAAINFYGGRFLRKDDASGKWFEIKSEKAYEKVGQALREGMPKTRDKLLQEEVSFSPEHQQFLMNPAGRGTSKLAVHLGGDQHHYAADSAAARASSTSRCITSQIPAYIAARIDANRNNYTISAASSNASSAPPQTGHWWINRPCWQEQEGQQNSCMDNNLVGRTGDHEYFQMKSSQPSLPNRSPVQGLVFWPTPPPRLESQRNSLIFNEETINAPGNKSSMFYPSPPKRRNPYSSSSLHPTSQHPISARNQQKPVSEEKLEDSSSTKPSAAHQQFVHQQYPQEQPALVSTTPTLDSESSSSLTSPGLEEERGKRQHSSFEADTVISLHAPDTILSHHGSSSFQCKEEEEEEEEDITAAIHFAEQEYERLTRIAEQNRIFLELERRNQNEREIKQEQESNKEEETLTSSSTTTTSNGEDKMVTVEEYDSRSNNRPNKRPRIIDSSSPSLKQDEKNHTYLRSKLMS